MGLTVSSNGGSTFVMAPEGAHVAVCTALIDLGTQTNEYKGKQTHSRQVFIEFELVNEEKQNDIPVTIGEFYTASLGEKANLRKALASWRGRDFTKDELDGFALAKILGKPCQLSVMHKVKTDGNTRAKIAAIMPLTKGSPTPATPDRTYTFDIDEWDQTIYEGLGEFFKKKIAESPEGRAKLGGAQPVNQSQAKVEGEIPF